MRLIGLAAAALLLAGCSTAPDGKVGGDVVYREVHTPNGPVGCIIYQSVQEGGISCDWSSPAP